MEWKHTSPVKVKAKLTISTRKIVETIFWDRDLVLLINFMSQGKTIKSAAYSATLRKLRCAIQNKRRRLLSVRVVARQCTTSCCWSNLKELIRSFGWITHFALSDYHLFRYLKEFIGGSAIKHR